MSWVEEYRKLFPAAGSGIFMDTSYDCGGSEIGRAAAMRYFDDWGKAAASNERGGPGRAVFFRTADETRSMIAHMLGDVDYQQIAFTRNTNEGINMILQGFHYEAGDNIVFHEKDHDSVVMPVLSAHEHLGVAFRLVRTSERIVTAQELMDACDEHTRIIVTSHIQPATGYRIDLEKLGAFCKEKGIFLVVDAIQSLGIETLDAPKWGVDAVSAAGYKWLGAINSIGFFYISKQLAGRVSPVFTAAGAYMDYEPAESGWHLICTDETKARKFENSSLDNLGIYTLHDSLEKIHEIGIDRIRAHVEDLVQPLIKGLKEQGWNVMTPEDPQHHCSIVSLLPSDKKAVFDYFRAHNVVLSISAQTYIRFGIAAYTTMEDIQQLLTIAAQCPIR